jgi:hypothetical protein
MASIGMNPRTLAIKMRFLVKSLPYGGVVLIAPLKNEDNALGVLIRSQGSRRTSG